MNNMKTEAKTRKTREMVNGLGCGKSNSKENINPTWLTCRKCRGVENREIKNCNIKTEPTKTKEIVTKQIKRVNEKQNKCKICEYSSSCKSDLKKHVELLHKGILPHKCPLCNYSCAKNNTLTRHVESVHEGKKPFTYTICTQGYSNNSDLKSR